MSGNVRAGWLRKSFQICVAASMGCNLRGYREIIRERFAQISHEPNEFDGSHAVGF